MGKSYSTFDWLVSSLSRPHISNILPLPIRSVQHFSKEKKCFCSKSNHLLERFRRNTCTVIKLGLDKSPWSPQGVQDFLNGSIGEVFEKLVTSGEAVGYTVNCMDGSFEVHEWCLYNSDILLTLHQGMIYKFSLE